MQLIIMKDLYGLVRNVSEDLRMLMMKILKKIV